MVEKFTVDDAKRLYGVDNWGAGYFDFSPEGNLLVLPTRDPGRAVDVRRVVDGLVAEGASLPILLRFPQILSSQVRHLCEAFAHAIHEFDYGHAYRPVYPIKVNQQRPVVEEVLKSGARFAMGIEVGSKTELLVGLSFNLPAEAFVVCNGFKDQDYVRLALFGAAVGKNVIVVVERPAELETLIQLARELKVRPLVGLRMKLSARGSGKWEKSTGYISKFGLSTVQLLESIALLEEAKMADCLRLFHFHLGSQVPDVRRFNSAVKEAAIIYAKVKKKHPSVDILNVGGGVGVDYDGSKTASDASVNYTLQEFANGVVYTVKEVCKHEEVAEPILVTETGRVTTAYHSLLVADTLGAIRLSGQQPLTVSDDDPQPVTELYFLRENINSKNFQEYYHDGLQQRDDLAAMFNLGYCSLESRARADLLFWDLCQRVVRLARTQKYVPDEFELLEHKLAEKAIVNFSVFQSVPDSWALDQLFPIVPVSHLHRPPKHKATLVDLTCDSDGEIDKFVDLKDIEQSLPLHDVTAHSPYYLAILLIGAYQEVLGDYHNLFGAVSEAHIVLGDDGRHLVKMFKKAQSSREVVQLFGYDGSELEAAFERTVMGARDRGQVNGGLARTIVKSYGEALDGSAYLAPAPARRNGRAVQEVKPDARSVKEKAGRPAGRAPAARSGAGAGMRRSG